MCNSLRRASTVCLGFVSLGLFAQPVFADLVTFQEGGNNIFVAGYAGTDDNQIMDPGTGFQDANIGGRNAIQIGNASSYHHPAVDSPIRGPGCNGRQLCQH